MKLVYEKSGKLVQYGDTVQLESGRLKLTAVVEYFREPHKASSSGKVTVMVTNGPQKYRAEYYVGVIGAKWIERADRDYGFADDEYCEHCGAELALIDKPRQARPPLKKFNVHVRLADQYEAADEDEAFDMMMEALDHRRGLEIMGHDIIEDQS